MVDEPVHYYVDYSSEIKVSRMVQATKASAEQCWRAERRAGQQNSRLIRREYEWWKLVVVGLVRLVGGGFKMIVLDWCYSFARVALTCLHLRGDPGKTSLHWRDRCSRRRRVKVVMRGMPRRLGCSSRNTISSTWHEEAKL